MHDDTIVPVDDRLPFDAERARAGEPVCTAEGLRIIGGLQHTSKLASHSLYGQVARIGDRSWTEDGYYWASKTPTIYDLRMIRQPEKETTMHASNCATNMPTLPDGLCDCGIIPTRYDTATCEPFDRARAEKGEAVCDKEGWPVTIFTYQLRGCGADGRYIGCVIHFEGHDWIGPARAHDLRMAPRKTKRWWVVTLFSDSGVPYWTGLKQTKEAAVSTAAEITTGRAVVSYTDIPE